MTEENKKQSRATNIALGKARAAKHDEFYTRRKSIEEELWHYRQHFAGKVVYCNCDDPRVSEFYRYFKNNFSFFGLKKLLTTCYKSRNPDMFSRYDSERAVFIEYGGGDSEVRDFLQSDGDFRSPECIDLLRQADIVVTNPPFSLFREYIAQLVAKDKRFLVIGNVNAVSYKEIFRLIMAVKIWLGPSITSGDREFGVPDHYPLEAANCGIDKNGKKFVRVKGVRWFTNLDHKRRHDLLDPTARYVGNESAYPKYDNYDAIEVKYVADIPCDYAGVMGVPVTFLDKWNPDEFEILGKMTTTTVDECNFGYPYVDGKRKYARILIRNRRPQ